MPSKNPPYVSAGGCEHPTSLEVPQLLSAVTDGRPIGDIQTLACLNALLEEPSLLPQGVLLAERRFEPPSRSPARRASDDSRPLVSNTSVSSRATSILCRYELRVDFSGSYLLSSCNALLFIACCCINSRFSRAATARARLSSASVRASRAVSCRETSDADGPPPMLPDKAVAVASAAFAVGFREGSAVLLLLLKEGTRQLSIFLFDLPCGP